MNIKGTNNNYIPLVMNSVPVVLMLLLVSTPGLYVQAQAKSYRWLELGGSSQPVLPLAPSLHAACLPFGGGY